MEMRNTAIKGQRALQVATQDLGAGYEANVDADPVRHFDGQGTRAVDAPPGKEF